MPSRSRRTLACGIAREDHRRSAGMRPASRHRCSAFIGPRQAKDSRGGDACSLHHDPRTTRGKGPYAPELRPLVTCITIHNLLFTPQDSAIVRREQHHSRPRESRSPNASSATLPPDDDRVSVFSFHGRLSNSVRSVADANRPACERVQAGRSDRSFGRNAGGTYPIRPCPVPPAFWFLCSFMPT